MTEFLLKQLARWAVLLLFLLTRWLSAHGQENVPVEQLRQVVTASFLETGGFQADKLQIEIPELPADLARFAGTDFRVLPSTRTVRKGSQYATIGIFKAGELIHDFTTRVVVKTFEQVVVSKAPILRHTELSPEDLQVQRRETTYVVKEACGSVAELAGFRAGRFIPEGEILTRDLVEKMPVVTKGQRVRIHFVKNALEIVLPGLAREDGGIGDKVTVKSSTTNKRYSATVVDAENVFLKLW